MNTTEFEDIVLLIQDARVRSIKSVNAEMLQLYWNVGAYLNKQIAEAKWGEKTVVELAEFIEKQHPDIKGFNKRGLYRMKQFHSIYSKTIIVSSVLSKSQNFEIQTDTIVSSVMTQLENTDIRNSIVANISWTHHLSLMSRTKSDEELLFYLKLCIRENYSVRELERQISSSAFERIMIGNERLPESLKEKHQLIRDNLKDSYVFEFLNLTGTYSEKELQKGLIQQMKLFILELGKDYLYIGEEYKVEVGNSDFFIDLLFYHRGLQCLIAFELKNDKFKPEHLGQLNFYLEALDRDVKKNNENPSIGILLCKDKDNEIVEYALSRSMSPTMVAAYHTQLPDKEILQKKLHDLFENSNN